MERYDQNSFYYSITEEMWCWKQTSTGKIFKAKTKSELLSIKEKQFVGSGNYEREYNLGTGLVSTEEFGKITGVDQLQTETWVANIVRNNVIPAIAPQITEWELSQKKCWQSKFPVVWISPIKH